MGAMVSIAKYSSPFLIPRLYPLRRYVTVNTVQYYGASMDAESNTQLNDHLGHFFDRGAFVF